MRILGTVFFLSFLAGKLNAFEQMLLTEPIYKLSACVEKLPYFWRESFRQPFKYILQQSPTKLRLLLAPSLG